MKRFILLLLLAVNPAQLAHCQLSSFADNPVEIRSQSNAARRGSVVYEGNVVIEYAGTSIYCDYAEYNPDTRDVLVRGNVRVYRDGRIVNAQRGFYNLETKLFRAADFESDFYPMRIAGSDLGSLGPNEYRVRNGIFTTSDSSEPDYTIKAKTVRIYPDDRVVFEHVTLRIGSVPVFYFPYFYQSLSDQFGFSITPGYTSRWGGFLLTQSAFPITENATGILRLDYRSLRGVGTGFDSNMKLSPDGRSWARFRSYYTNDNSTGVNPTSTPRGEIDNNRYRISLQSRLYLSETLYATVDVDKLSDSEFLEDYEPGQFRTNPQPDNIIGLTKWNEDYTATVLGRFQFNSFVETTERLPEFVLDFKRTALYDSPVFYEGETGVAKLRRNYEDGSLFPDYDTLRADSFHQFLFPKTYFGWLSVVPRVGARATYYEKTGATVEDSDGVQVLQTGDAALRPVLNAGVESSFKFSREFEQVQSRAWGLDGLRHVVQPYTNFSYVWSGKDPDEILQFDRYTASSQLAPIDFPAFTSIDAINNWTVWRVGTRNRLQTRRDNETHSWLELDSYVDVNIENPQYPGLVEEDGQFSNLFNNLRFRPLPWVAFNIDSQIPLVPEGFSQVNTSADLMLSRSLQLNIGHRYITNNPSFEDSSLASLGGYLRLNENWGFSVRERYEVTDNTLESQRYSLHRDLSSWIASLGVIIHDNGEGKNEYGFLLSFTLKDMPQANIPFSFDPQESGD